VSDSPEASHSVSPPDEELRTLVQRTLVSSYDVEREIGRGGMGVVYRAIDKRLKRPVAIKVLPPELAFRREIRQRFQREAETAARLTHPHIVPIYSVDDADNFAYFVMACVDGDNLATQLRKRGPLPVDDVQRYLAEVTDALAYAHACGVIHRDIKPDNVLVDAIDGRAIVTDFGIARAVEATDVSRLTATGLAIGTPTYMSPEQAAGDRDVDGRSDLYSLGVVAYQMLAGEPPFHGGAAPMLLMKHMTEMPVPVQERRPDTPPQLAELVMRLLAKDPAHRVESAHAVLAALRGEGFSPRAATAFARNGHAETVSPFPNAPHTTPPRAAPSANGSSASSASSAPPPPSTSTDDIARWEHPAVQKLRRKLVPYVFINTVLVAMSVVTDNNLLPVVGFWTVYIAYQYTKLWAEGHDWRDVLRQPSDRMFGDWLSEVGEHIVSVFSAKKRQQLRQEGRTRGGLSRALSPRTPSDAIPATDATAPSAAAAVSYGTHVEAVETARATRAELLRLVNTTPHAERTQLPDVDRASQELVARVETLATTLAATDALLADRSLELIDREIAQLEAHDQVLDQAQDPARAPSASSEARARKLSMLHRTRRATMDLVERRQTLAPQLDACVLALEAMRMDLVRLRTGDSTLLHITTLAQDAMQLARDVDRAVSSAQDLRPATTS
jgi:serine/threonine-protein kinase